MIGIVWSARFAASQRLNGAIALTFIKPSKKNIKTFLGGIRKTIKAALGMSAADLIHKLNPKIRGWTNYHRHVVSTRTFARVDHHIFSSL